MLLIIFAMVHISSAIDNEITPEVTEGHEICLNLIKKIGDIACLLIGEQGFDRLGESTCLIHCSGGEYPITLPDGTCDRIFKPEHWQAYFKMFNHLPPLEYQECGVDWKRKLERWLESWEKRSKAAHESICKTNGRQAAGDTAN
uniref:Putative ixodes 10 kDa peptide protein n=1 Tax=Ixodes ricinus TaxID=34613 RepID=A0A0K8R3H0_IXORI